MAQHAFTPVSCPHRGARALCARAVLVFPVMLALAAAVHAQTAPQPTPPSTPQPTRPGEVTGTARPGMPPRDTPPPAPAPGIARIRGVITAAETGAPLRQVFVRLGGAEMREGRAARTDADGRYEFTELPAGRFTLMAMKPGFVNVSYGQRTPLEPGRPIDIKDGETVQADFAMPRGGVVAGRVLDEFGEPIPDVQVSVLRFQTFRGRRQLVPSGRSDSTNDLGQYRLWGLAPGEYYVNATNRMAMFMGPESPSASASSGYAPTFYPGTPNPAEAQPVTVMAGAEAVADFTLVPTRVSQISGRMVDSTGKPVTGGQVRVIPTGDAVLGPAAGFMGTGGIVREDGAFTVGGVAPGNYLLVGVKRDFRTPDDAGVEMVELPVVVAGEDLTDLVLTTRPGGTAVGTVTIEGGAPPTLVPTKLTVLARPNEPDQARFIGGLNARPAPLKDDWTFALSNLFGRLGINVTGLPSGYAVKSVTVGATDVTDSGFEPRPGRRVSLQVVVSNRWPEITGRVTNDRGEPEPDSVVVVFPEDSAKWTSPNTFRYTRISRPDGSAHYRVTALPPGEYLAVAVERLDAGSQTDPEVLEKLRPLARSVRLGDADKAVVNLTVRNVP